MPLKTIIIILLVSLVLVSLSAFMFGYFSSLSADDEKEFDLDLDESYLDNNIILQDEMPGDVSKHSSFIINAKGDSIRIEGKDHEIINDLSNTNVKLNKNNTFDPETGIKNYKVKDFDGSEYDLEGSQVSRKNSFQMRD